MKKAILLCVLLIGMIGFTFAQTSTFPFGSATQYKSTTDVTVGDGATVWFQWDLNKETPTTQDYFINLDSISGGAHTTTVKLYGAKIIPVSGSTVWTQIGSTITWKATTADTTITISNATAARWNFLKTEIVNASGDVSKVDWQIVKVWKE